VWDADGTKDEKDGYSTVVVQATGHHTGKAFSLPKVDAPAVGHTSALHQLCLPLSLLDVHELHSQC